MKNQAMREDRMDGRDSICERLASLLGEVAVHEGMHPTLIDGVRVLRRSEPLPRAPMVYHPNIVIVGQGRKRAYLVSSVPMPAECEADASPEDPILNRRHRR